MATYTIFATDGGIAATGLTPTVTHIRGADGTAAGISAPTVEEIDSVNAPGHYRFAAVPTKRTVLTVDLGAGLANAERYVPLTIDPSDFSASETRLARLDTDIAAQVWNALASSFSTSNSMGMLLRIIAGLSHRNYRVVPTYNDNREVTAATIKLYPSSADTDADTNAFATFTISATYADAGNGDVMTLFKAKGP